MFSLKIQLSFASAHNLRNYKGNCESLHGHNWKVAVSIISSELDEAGMVMDFKDLKKITNNVLEELDHKYLNDLPAFKDQNPSSENLARYIYFQIKDEINNNIIKLHKVTVWESDNCSASFREMD